MSIFGVIILGLILFVSLITVILYLIKPFRNNDNPCGGCPYSNGCGKRKK